MLSHQGTSSLLNDCMKRGEKSRVGKQIVANIQRAWQKPDSTRRAPSVALWRKGVPGRWSASEDAAVTRSGGERATVRVTRPGHAPASEERHPAGPWPRRLCAPGPRVGRSAKAPARQCAAARRARHRTPPVIPRALLGPRARPCLAQVSSAGPLPPPTGALPPPGQSGQRGPRGLRRR